MVADPTLLTRAEIDVIDATRTILLGALGRATMPFAYERVFNAARAYHDLRARIEEMRRTYKANDDLYKKTHVADIIMHLDHLLAEQEPTACHPACGPDYCAVDFCKREQEPTDGQR